MKTLHIIVFLIFVTSCNGQKKTESPAIKSNNDATMIVKKESKIPEDAFQINLGFADAPVWMWVKFDHVLSTNNKSYNHIYGLNFWDEDENVDTLYYERDRENKNDEIIDFSNYIINRYPGDKTLQLVGKDSDTLLLFNVLENKKFRRTFKGKDFKSIPTVKINHNNEKVSGYDMNINVLPKEDSFYEVTILNEGINTYTFKSNCTLKDDFDISYYDMTNGRIYLLQKDCYLEKIE